MQTSAKTSVQTSTPPLRLNYGCGDTRMAGYLGVDVRPCRGADHVLAAWDTSPFQDESVEEIYSRHMLEHLDPQDAHRTLAAWFRILRPDGLLRLIVPDIAFHARQILGQQTAWTDDPAENLAHAMAGFYGWHDSSRGGSNEDAHRWGYTWETCGKFIRRTGFVHVQRVLSGADSEPWHLHVTARKPRRGRRC